MRSGCGERARKRRKEEESLKVVGKASKAPKFNGERAVKSVFGGAGKTTSSSEKNGDEGGKVEGNVVERVIGGDSFMTVPGSWPEILLGWDEWPCYSSVVEEQMLWGSLWFPSWEEQFKGGFCGEEQVLWEDDIWHLKDIKETPKP